MPTTRFTQLIGIDLPIALAPMGRWADGGLAAAVSAAGGLGTFGAWASMGINEAYVRRQIETIRARTDRPFGAGFATHHIRASIRNFEAVLDEHVPVILLSFDDPTPWIPAIHDSGALAICQVQTFRAAQEAVDAGADVLCIQGNEAGGHTGHQNLLPALIRALEAFPHLPVIASGGISGGRSLAAVLAAGADGAWVGTALLAADEATFQPELAPAILGSDGADTVHSKSFDVIFDAWDPARPTWPPGIALRSRRNAIIDQWDGRESDLAADPSALGAAIDALGRMDPLVFPMIFGEGATEVRRRAPVAELLEAMIASALDRLNRFNPADDADGPGDEGSGRS